MLFRYAILQQKSMFDLKSIKDDRLLRSVSQTKFHYYLNHMLITNNYENNVFYFKDLFYS